MSNSQHVTFVASDATPQLSELVAAIEAKDYRVTKADRIEHLASQLNKTEKTTVLVYTEQGDELPFQVLTELSNQQRKCPVIVVVDRADFAHYYELMCEGAYDYYELSEGSEVITRAVRWAAQTRGS